MPQKKTSTTRTGSTTRRTTQRKASTARRATGAAKAPPVELTHEMISKRAYEIWLTNIKRAYQPAQDWAEAEKQLRAELKKKPARAKPAARQPKPQPAPAPAPAMTAAQSPSDSRLAA